MIFGIVDRLIRRLIRRSFKLGVLEGSVPWLAAGAAALLVRLMFKPEPAKIQREKLALGETLIVTHRPPADPQSRKKRPATSLARQPQRQAPVHSRRESECCSSMTRTGAISSD